MFDTIIVDVGSNTQKLKEKFPHAKVVKYDADVLKIADSVINTIATSHFWILYGWCDYTEFDLAWEPEWHQDKQIHVWPSNGQTHGGYTVLIPRAEFKKQRKNFQSLQDFDCVCWHDTVIPAENQFDIFIMNMGGNDNNINELTSRFPDARVFRYITGHLGMVIRALNHAKTPYVWLIGSCCSYDDFDFGYKPNWENKDQIHCWASATQKFGDTFLIPVEAAKNQINEIEKLEYFNSIKWIEAGVPRLPWPTHYVGFDDLFKTVRNHTFTSMYEQFIIGNNEEMAYDPPLWEDRPLIVSDYNGHVSLVPKDVKTAIKRSLNEYHNIVCLGKQNINNMTQDIVFISYDEEKADENWYKLKHKFNHAKRVQGVKGMHNALKAAAKESNTPWFYAVFPKTQIVSYYRFDFPPNYLDPPGHYIFQSYNVLTDLMYGHGGVVLYHTDTVLESTEWNFDYTTSFTYYNVPELSCSLDVETPFEAWRTSFREVLKLKEQHTIESEFRLYKWLQPSPHQLSPYSVKGAEDALAYEGDIHLANDWDWLLDKFKK